MLQKQNEKLAEALKSLQKLQKKGAAIHTASLDRGEREMLSHHGYLQPVIEGWYISTRPDEPAGSTTSWYASMMDFIASYCETRFGNKWYLSPEDSIAIHVGCPAIPQQVRVHTEAATNNTLELLHRTSLMMYKPPTWPSAKDITIVGKMRVLKLEVTLCSIAERFFVSHQNDTILALSLIKDPSELIGYLLENNKPVVTARLVGAFEIIGRPEISSQIVGAFSLINVKIKPTNPFENPIPQLKNSWDESPYVNRIRLMWAKMRNEVIEVFGAQPASINSDIHEVFAKIEDRYVDDAYNSLSIEGYQVTDELIERVRSGNWDPEKNKEDSKDRNALAARGYFEAHNRVKESIEQIIKGENPGQIALIDHSRWYQALFAPMVSTGILKPQQLVGYRNSPVYIRNANHVPLNVEAVRDTMPELFKLINEEPHPAVRAVLGHFIFVYIHPYMDGNGRTGRFLMNAMLVSGGYEWTVIRVETKKDYMAALNEASGKEKIKDFATYIKNEMAAYKPKQDSTSKPRVH